MEKFDKGDAYFHLSKMIDRISNMKSQLEQGQACLTEIPNFLQAIWDHGRKYGYEEGMKEGVEEGKKIRFNGINTQN